MITLRQSGVGIDRIALLNGTTRQAVFSKLRRRKIAFSRYGGPVGIFKKGDRIKGRLTREEIVKLYSDSNETLCSVARADGTTVLAVKRVLRKAGVPLRSEARYRKHGFYQNAKKLGVGYETYFRLLAIEKLGGKCVKCGNSDLRVLQLNHVTERKNFNGSAVFSGILNGTVTDRDVRCANCNLIYEYERGRRFSFPPEVIEAVRRDTARLSQVSAPCR